MALPKRLSPSPPQNSSGVTRDLKQRVISSLNKLSDRDTHAIACSELESIAQTLTPDSFSSFLSCIYTTDSSHKSPVRRQSVRLLGLMAAAHGDDLAPYVPRMVGSAVVRRLRDPDTAVRSACVEAVAAMAAQITRPPFSSFLRPLSEALLLEQDGNAQIGAALCLASAIEAAPRPDVAQLQRLLPRLVKLLRSPSFKAKPALLSLIGCAVGAGAARGGQLLSVVVSSLAEFLSSEDWAARKAAADALARVAVAERDLLPELKASYLASFEARRFDKVKAVRDSINRMLDVWKDIPDISNNVTTPSQLKSSSIDSTSDGHFPPRSRSSGTLKSSSPYTRSSYSPLSRSTPSGSDKRSGPPLLQKLDHNKLSDWKVEIAVPNAPPVQGVCEGNLPNKKGIVGRFLEQGENKNNRHLNSKIEAKRALFENKHDDKTLKFGGLRSGSRVVPVREKETSESTVQRSNTSEELIGGNKDNDLSLIRKQLVQIESQQSSLLDLLQMFIGNSQNGMRSLETRVQSLEVALDEISHGLAVSTGRMGNSDTAGNACFKLPGAEFLSSKLWRRTEGRYSTSRFLTSSSAPLVSIRNVTDKEAAGSSQTESWRFGLKGGFVVNPLAEIHPESKGSTEVSSNRAPKNGLVHEPNGRSSA
ncbi:microtubule-associated protein TORTIFOLIA1-like protein [Cinnamomum micranthum f. kanehirae]|uniref:Microtubule-associated protein TORTIFOLIA1-like protein n=1 Tax=Cinnamomum micranthum f. kanehirae TaxID=337451 RepID=A0A3S3PZD3_9MAGN|nr:microtubule-associated protein TORTIFOLIA1-like protein [Cinnamomum micranthum f. kanehirae]